MWADFFNQNNGRYVDFDGAYGFQCFDLVNKWSTALGYRPFTGLYASGIYGQPQGNYTQIPNSPTAVPQAGDIIVWNNNYGGGYGHTGIATGNGNTSWFESLDQNWPGGSPSKVVRHDYNGVIGWLRPNKLSGQPQGEDMIQSGDNYYARANKLHQQVRGRGLSREVFNAFVGKSWLTFIETLSDDPEADNWNTNGQVGAIARRDRWDLQIYSLQDQLKKATDLVNTLNDRLVKSENTTKALTEKVDKLNAKVAELDSPDNIVVSRGFFNSLFDKIKNIIRKG